MACYVEVRIWEVRPRCPGRRLALVRDARRPVAPQKAAVTDTTRRLFTLHDILSCQPHGSADEGNVDCSEETMLLMFFVMWEGDWTIVVKQVIGPAIFKHCSEYFERLLRT